MEQTIHYKETKGPRYDFINEKIGFGNIVRSFTIDRGHPNGPEIHTLTDTGVIIVQNERTKKIITLLIARPQQIIRLYNLTGDLAPQELLALAYEHEKLGYNMV